MTMMRNDALVQYSAMMRWCSIQVDCGSVAVLCLRLGAGMRECEQTGDGREARACAARVLS